MKQLTLVRHAKSSWKQPQLADYDRPLNKRGKSDLHKLAERLFEYKITPQRIITSGALRALTTATAIKTQLNLADDDFFIQAEVYESCSETLLYLLQNCPDHLQHIMLVGHNPGLEMLSGFLSQTPLEKFPTAAVVQLHLSIKNWHELAAGCATITLFDYPKMHLPL